MDMQDKEFDELFHDRLKNLTVNPSGAVWRGIAGQLDKGKLNNKMAQIVSIAATIVVLVTAGIVFSPRTKPASKKPSRIAVVKVSQPKKAGTVANTVATVINARIKNRLIFARAKSQIAIIKSAKAAAATYHHKTQNASAPVTVGSTVKNEQPVMAAAILKPQEITPGPPDENTALVIKQPASGQTISPDKPLSAAPVSPVSDAIVKAKHKGHTLGDLINVVIAQVDKRKDKFIEFSDTDDDQSSITGVNIGIIKIKKAK